MLEPCHDDAGTRTREPRRHAMFPHADTIYTINALDYEEKMRLAARDRLAASAQMSTPSRPPIWESALPVITSGLTVFVTRLRGTKRRQESLPMASNPA